MDIVQYYITTISTALGKIGPAIAFIVGGYVLFFKLPFWLFKNNLIEEKKKYQEQNPPQGPAIEAKEQVQPRMKLASAPPKEEPKAQKKEEKKQEKKKEEPKRPEPKKNPLKLTTEEEIFELLPGQTFTKEELRKKYYELLKLNHPDKVAALGKDLKKLAESKTKEINTAYDKLKSRAS